ncbi:MAG TPA: hypothetical protein V6D20_23685 [Candidatus Obscuribacterales bacterium]
MQHYKIRYSSKLCLPNVMMKNQAQQRSLLDIIVGLSKAAIAPRLP